MGTNRWGWVRPLPDQPRGSYFEACGATVTDPPGVGWIKVTDDRLVELLFHMQSHVFTAEAALANAEKAVTKAHNALYEAKGVFLR